MARKCACRRSRRSRQSRMARTPRKGLASLGRLQRGHWLVSADIEGSDHRRSLLHRLFKGEQGCELLLFARDIVSIEEKKLGAEESDSLGAVVQGIWRLRSVAEIGEDLDGVVVGGGRWRMAEAGDSCRLFLARVLPSRSSSNFSADGLSQSSPLSPSKAAVVVPFTGLTPSRSNISLALAIAGMPRARKRMAACDVLPPCRQITPTTDSRDRPATCAGVRSSATRIPGWGRCGAWRR